MSEPRPDPSFLVGVTKFGSIMGRSREWARWKFKAWRAEQEKGGPQRIWMEGHRMYTTIAVIQRENPHIRDPLIMRKLKEHDDVIDTQARRINQLTDQVRVLFKMLEGKNSTSRLRAG